MHSDRSKPLFTHGSDVVAAVPKSTYRPSARPTASGRENARPGADPGRAAAVRIRA
ncbi:hypothetical protein B005_2078 [Nocardiopsis alba ATCC BAA-2165]|uniref:Uncharacterized protein n=1 Tax=Nocardiopsis alba (strain ATCC BAA-2165 / BE74) TaxID=1205910 RepID=J7LGY0_NOCAA|nr:hypothetical protein B005_2078 [Nocardiopsis alba ATCC BAA-2165]